MWYSKHIRLFMRRTGKLAVKTCDFLAFRRAAQRVSQFYDAQLAPSGLCMGEFAALVRLKRHKRVRLVEFFENTSFDRGAVNRNLRRLAEAGFIRIARPAIKERTTVTLTRQGLNALKRAVPFWQAAQIRFEVLNGGRLKNTLNGLLLES